MHQHLPRSRRLSVTSSSSLPHHLTSSTHQDSHDHDNAATSCFPSMLLMIRDDEYQTLSSPFEDDNQEQLFHQHEPSKAAMFEALSNSRERRMSLNNIMQPCANCNKLLCDCLPSMSHTCATVSSSSLPSTQITETKDQQPSIMKGGRRRGSIMLEQVQLNERVPLDTPIMLQHVETGMFLQATIDNIAIPPAIVREEHIGMDCLNHHTSHIWMFRASKQSGEHVGDDDFDRLSRVNIVSALDQKIGLGRVNDQITVTNHSSMLCEWDVKVTQGKFFMPLSSEFEATQPSKSHAPVVVLRLVPTLPGLKKGGSASIKSTMSTDEMVVSVNQLSEQQRLALVPVSTNEYATLTLQEEMKDMSDDFNVNAAEQEWSIVKVRYL